MNKKGLSVLAMIVLAVAGILFGSVAYKVRNGSNSFSPPVNVLGCESDRDCSLSEQSYCFGGSVCKKISNFECVNRTCVFESEKVRCEECEFDCKKGECVPAPGDDGLPDLVVRSIEVIANGEGNVSVEAIVRNVGEGDAGTSVTSFFVSPMGGQRLVFTPVILAGEVGSIVASYDLPSGTYDINVSADSTNRVEESNEDNNNLFEEIRI